MSTDKRFAIVDREGRARYPFRAMRGEGSGKFVLRASVGNGKRKSMFVDTIEEVVHGVIRDRLRVRVRTGDDQEKMSGSLSLHAKNEAIGYLIDPALFHLIDAADMQPLENMPTIRPSATSKLYPIDAARDFVQNAVLAPALESNKLDQNTKDKVKNSQIWLRQFRRVGDIFNYLQRFRHDNDDPVYLKMKNLGLQTFEDIGPEFSKRFSLWKSDCTRPTDFIVGEKYSAHEILIFVGSYDTRSGGMFVLEGDNAPSMVVIKATLNGGKYNNEWLVPARALKYYFKSIKKNGVEVFGGHFKTNAAILEAPGIPILTFVRESNSEDFTFYGVFSYESDHRDENGARWFKLSQQKSARESIMEDAAFLQRELAEGVQAALNGDRAERLKRLAAAPKKPLRVMTQSIAYLRSPDVIAEVLIRASGVCEQCLKPAPFISKSKGTPYLEVHHRQRLADGGDDTVENAIALCPNCHREQHFG